MVSDIKTGNPRWRANRLALGIWVVLACLPVVGAGVGKDMSHLDLLQPSRAWSAQTDHADGARMTLEADKEGLHVTVQGDGGREDYPKIRRMFTPARDWRGYARLHVRMRAVCHDPEIRRKQIGFVFYDDKTRHADLPGHPMKQQIIAPVIPVNHWIDATYWLRTIQRSAIRQLDVYLYENVGGGAHTVQWEFAALDLQEIKGEVVALDGEVYGTEELSSGASGRLVGTVRTNDGLGLTGFANGGVRLDIDGKVVGTGPGGCVTGILVRDVVAGGAPRPVGGEVRLDHGILHQRGVVPGLGLRVDAEFRAGEDAIDIRGSITDLRDTDRAVTVMVAVPVSAGDGWQWWDNAVRARTVTYAADGAEFDCLERGMHYGLHGLHAKYPLSALDVPRATSPFGLSLAIRMDEPVVHRIAWNPRLHLFWIAFDFGLVPGHRVDGRPLGTAPFHVLLYRHDPAWGFRSALDRYYHMFPGFFQHRLRQGGGWYVWGNMSDTPEALAGGLGFHWGPRDAKAVTWDNAHGVIALYYIESETYQQSMEDFAERPSCREALERLDKLAAGDAHELDKVARQPYKVYPLAGGGGGVTADIHEVCRVVKASLSFDIDGRPFCSVGKRGWMSKSRWGAIMACNLDPAIPEGKGWYNMRRMIQPALEAMRKNGAHYDGIALDSFGGYGQAQRANYRREHFPYTDAPLSFSAGDLRPVQVAAFGTVAWLRDLARSMHAQGNVLMANCSWGNTPAWLMFAAPYLDIFGAEAPQFADSDFMRAMAFRKPCTDLPYKPRPDWEVSWHWLHGTYPGMGNTIAALKRSKELLQKLNAAGWEPITAARADPPTIRLERFGKGPVIFLVAHNPDSTSRHVRIMLDKNMGAEEKFSVTCLPDKRPVEWRKGSLGLALESRETVVLRLTPAGPQP